MVSKAGPSNDHLKVFIIIYNKDVCWTRNETKKSNKPTQTQDADLYTVQKQVHQ